MSKLISDLIASTGSSESPEKLTLEIGKYLQQSGRQDVIDGDPEFKAEFDAITRAMRPSLGTEVGTALQSGLTDALPRDLFGLLAAGSEGMGRAMGVKGAGADYLALAKEQDAEAAAKWAAIGGRSVPSISDIGKTGSGVGDYIGDIARYALPTVAEAAPGLAVGMLAGGVGGALLKATPLVGAAAGIGALSTAQGIGGEYARLGNEPGADPDKALVASAVGGTLSGLINAAAMMLPISRLFPGATPTVAQRMAANVLERAGINDGVLSKAAGLATRAAVSGTQGAAVFSPISVVSQAFSIAAQEYATGNPLPGDQVRKQLIDAASSGAVTGAAMNLGMEPFARHAAPEAPVVKPTDTTAVEAAKVARDAQAGPLTPGQKALQGATDAVDSAERSIFGNIDTNAGLNTAVAPGGMGPLDFAARDQWALSAPDRMGVGPAERTQLADVLREGGPVIPAAETALADQLRNETIAQPEDAYANAQGIESNSGGSELPRISPRGGVPENGAPSRVGGGQSSDEGGGVVLGREASAVAPRGEAGQVETAVLETRPLPDNALVTVDEYEGHRSIAINVPGDHPNSRPIFSGSPDDAVRAGYTVDLPESLPVGKFRVSEITKPATPDSLGAQVQAKSEVKDVNAITPDNPLDHVRGVTYFAGGDGTNQTRLEVATDGMQGKGDRVSRAKRAILLEDNLTGQVYMKGLGVHGSDIRIQNALKNGRGSQNKTVLDMDRGHISASAEQIMAEKMPGSDIPRFDVRGFVDFKETQGQVSDSFASEKAMRDHPDMLRGEQARLANTNVPKRSRTGARIPSEKTVSLDKDSLGQRISIDDVAERLADTHTPAEAAMAGEEAPTGGTAEALNYISNISKLMREGVSDETLIAGIEKLKGKRVDQKFTRSWLKTLRTDLTIRSVDSWRPATTEQEALFSRVVDNLKTDGADVAVFSNEAVKAMTGMAGELGFQITDADGRSLIGLSADVMSNRLSESAVVRLLHESAHHVLKQIPADIQAAYHSAIERMPVSNQRWLMNPRSLDLRLLANARPETLSEVQKAALSRVTPAELQRLRQTPQETLTVERMTEHLAQLGVDRTQSRTLIQKIIGTVKAVMYRVAMAMQKAFKGPDAISPALADRYVQNRFQQFIGRDVSSEFIQSFRRFIGAPATLTERYDHYRSLDGDIITNYHYDAASGTVIPNDIATHTPQAVIDQVNKALMIARNNVEARKSGLDYTLIAPGESLGPETAAATVFSTINHEEDVMRRIRALPGVSRLLGAATLEKMQSEYMGIPIDHQAGARRNAAVAEFQNQVDPTTEQKFNLHSDARLNNLPVSEDGSSSRDLAVRELLHNFLDYKANVQDELAKGMGEIDRLSGREKNKTISEGEVAELDALNRRVPILQRILDEPGGLNDEIGRLGSKIELAYNQSVVPGGKVNLPPHENATEAEIMKPENAITIPQNMIYSVDQAKTVRSRLGTLDSWLANPANVEKGAIYGSLKTISRQLHVIDTRGAYAANGARFRKSAFGSISSVFRNTGLPTLRWLGERIYELQGHIDPNASDATIKGDQWSHSMRNWKEAMGADKMSLDEFRRLYLNPTQDLMTKIPDGTPLRVEKLMESLAKIKGREIPLKAQPAFREFERQTREGGRLWTKWFNEFSLKVKDPELGNMYRGLVRQGYHTGQRSLLTDDIGAILQAMAPTWNETGTAVKHNIAALYSGDKANLSEQLKAYFPPSVVERFVRPLIEGTQLRFNAPKDPGQVIRSKARLSSVRAAFRQADGDMVAFSDALYRLEGGRPGGAGEFAQDTMDTLNHYFGKLEGIIASNDKANDGGIETYVREMMDPRIANDLPDEWTKYKDYDANTNHMLLMRLAINSSLGRDGAASAEFRAGKNAAEKTLIELLRTETDYRMLEHKTPKEIKELMGADEYEIALQAPSHLDMVQKLDHIITQATKTTGQLLGEMRPLVEGVQLNSNILLQNPRSVLFQAMDIFAPFYRLGLSRTAFKEVAAGANTTLASLTHSLTQTVGAHLSWNADFLSRIIRNGFKDANNYITVADQFADHGAGAMLDRPSRPEVGLGKVVRVTRLLIKRAKALTNLSVGDLNWQKESWPLLHERERLGPKFRLAGIFTTGTNALNNGAFAAMYTSYFDLVARGVELINRSGDPQRMANALRVGDTFLDGKSLGYKKGWILDDSRAFNELRESTATKLGQGSIEQMVADAWTRTHANPNDPLITDALLKRIGSLASAEINMNGGFTSTPVPFYNEHLMLFSPFMAWPIKEMYRVNNMFRDPQGRANVMSAIGGLKAMMLGIVPLVLAASYATDLYDEKIYGKKSNIKNLKPGDMADDPAAFTAAAIERLARFGVGGLASEAASRLVNIDSPRGATSIGDRILIFSQLDNFAATMSALFNSHGNFTYASFVRPMLQMSGLGSALQYQQILNHQLGLTNQEAEINNRISVGNYLRSSGRDLGLNVRVGSQGSLPTPITPWIGQMQMAALSNDSALFNEAYQKAVAAVRKFKPDEEDPAKYVSEAFRSRHPLKSVFATTPTDREYQQILGDLNDQGRQVVQAAVGSFNRFSIALGGTPFLGKVIKPVKSPLDTLARIRNSTTNVGGAGLWSE